MGPIVHVDALCTEIVGTGVYRIADAHSVFNGNLAFVLIAIVVHLMGHIPSLVHKIHLLAVIGAVAVGTVSTQVVGLALCETRECHTIIRTCARACSVAIACGGIGIKTPANSIFCHPLACNLTFGGDGVFCNSNIFRDHLGQAGLGHEGDDVAVGRTHVIGSVCAGIVDGVFCQVLQNDGVITTSFIITYGSIRMRIGNSGVRR